MRVIAGSLKGRRLAAPEGAATRPILDRVKVALFDWLGSRLARPGELPPLRVLDLYCGSGSLGIESLSRGAAFCTFVEVEPSALACLRLNLSAFSLGSRACVVARAAESFESSRLDSEGFDLVFLDPPYVMSEALAPGSRLWRAISRLGHDVPLAAGALLVWRHSTSMPSDPTLTPDWLAVQHRRWGKMRIDVYEWTLRERSA